MARTGTDENKQANQQMSAIQQDQIRRANEATDAYNKRLGEIEAQGNPYDYNSASGATNLRNWNTLVGSASNAEEKAAEDEIEQDAKRTGLNSASTPYLKAEMGRRKTRDMATMRAQQAVEDQQNKISYDQWLLGAKLAPTGVDTSLFNTATGGRSSALNNLAQLGIASYGPVNAAIQAAGQAAGAALGKPPSSGGCWIAESLYGVDDPRTLLMRFWLNQVWAKQSRLGALLMKLYRRVGQRVAAWVKVNRVVRSGLRPVFDFGLKRAEAWLEKFD